MDRPMGALGTASVVVGAVGLGLRVLWRLRAMEKKRAKAAVVFEKELRRRGIPAHQAAVLRSVYEQGSLPELKLGRMLGSGAVWDR
ncbi:MAG TPA: hypothetical protein VI893_05725 [Thermoplasmata archaeon]|nr:hypothetical protein [Thermoplasmata archaeon]